MRPIGIKVVCALALAMLASPGALAQQFRVTPDETGTICQSGTKSEVTTIEGPNEVKIVHARQGGASAAICVAPESVSAIHLRWGSRRSSGTIGRGCAEVTGTSRIWVRPVNTNFHEVATFYSCVQEPGQQ